MVTKHQKYVFTKSLKKTNVARCGKSQLGKFRGWVGFVGSTESSLRTAVHPSDHLESLLVFAHYS
jgi:hypothetical protein